MKKFCPYCHALLYQDDDYCFECGRKLKKVSYQKGFDHIQESKKTMPHFDHITLPKKTSYKKSKLKRQENNQKSKKWLIYLFFIILYFILSVIQS